MSRLQQVAWAVCLALLACTGGCYDAHALLNNVRTDVEYNGLREVDLGVYRTTLPRDSQTHQFIKLKLHLFGTVPQYRATAIEKQLQTESYRLRYETLAAIRQVTNDELAEPDLTQLRSRLTKVVNNVLAETPVKSIGFEEFHLVYE